MKIVLDTNVWLSAIFWEGETYKLIKIIENKKMKIIITKKILFEITEVLNKESKFQKYIKNRKLAVEDLIRTILSISELVISKSKLNVIKEHPSDNKILESAIDGKVNYLISYDRHLLKLKRYKNIKILSPAELVKELK
jgi:hypothetical protein